MIWRPFHGHNVPVLDTSCEWSCLGIKHHSSGGLRPVVAERACGRRMLVNVRANATSIDPELGLAAMLSPRCRIVPGAILDGSQ